MADEQCELLEDGLVDETQDEQPQVEDVDSVLDDDEDSGALVQASRQPLCEMASQEEIDNLVKTAIARADATRRLKTAVLSMTNRYDWYAMRAEGEPDGKPYLAESGATKVMHAFGIQIKVDEGKRVPNEDGGYEYVYTGMVRAVAFSNAWFPVVGSRWSEDGFFTKGGDKRADPGDVRKAALTNVYNRAIKRACGINTITWEELEAVPHLKGLRTAVSKIGFTGGAGGASAPAGALSEIQKGPHIEVFVPYQNTNARKTVSNMPKDQRYFTGTEGNPKNHWLVRYNKPNLNRIADLAAENGDVKFTLRNVEKEEIR